MNSIIKNFCNNYLADKSMITLEKLINNSETCTNYVDTLDLTDDVKTLVDDMAKNFFQAMVILFSIANWEYLPNNDDMDLKQVYEDKISECINNTYRIAERIINY